MDTDKHRSKPAAELSRATCPHKAQSKSNSRGGDWDCVRQMRMFRHRPDVLANALLDMGVTESGDEVTDYNN